MNVTIFDRIKLLFSMYLIVGLLPTFQKKVAALLRPVDTTRYYEFAYLKKFIAKNNLRNMKVLDVSSPHMMAYYLSKNNHVTKTNIDNDEKKFIKENSNLSFKLEDATALSFPDNTFDLVYSISVIEHIYDGYGKAISEMIRVAKKGGYVYLTFPVACKHNEDWIDGYVYSNQFSSEGKTFFYYRFDENDIGSLFTQLHGVSIIHKDIFWETRVGLVDSITEKLNYKHRNKYITFIKDIVVNNYYGFTMFPSVPSSKFSKDKLFGVMHLVLRKN